MSLLRVAAPYALAASITYFATVLLLFYTELEPLLDEVGEVRATLPAVLEQVERVRQEIPAIVAEVAAVRAQIPPVLDEVAASREALPAVIDEIAAVRETVPPVMQQVERWVPEVLAESAALRDSLPSITRESAGWRNALPALTDEVAEVRQLVPGVLDEVAATRDAAPVLLDRAEELILAAESAGRDASRGAVTGVFTGLITAPFSIMRGVGNSLFGTNELNSKDTELLQQSGHRVLNASRIGATDSWRNRSSGVRGTSRLLSIGQSGEGECREVNFSVTKDGSALFDRDITACRDASGKWELQGPVTD